ncbi:glucoamylase family protein [Sinorhizobium sp. BG8]|uniref:glucoamylase family protein n=1 Tax=Sinorhizobium sp. BG8 TaxID=2613773 RepID=UPI00193DA372|nr:glucoamylase family protein [Sinorhizobium sp. BG8]QRM56412.1 hypothetical protein F3Y30_19120 [Sinorhizobium sp. BG8]
MKSYLSKLKPQSPETEAHPDTPLAELLDRLQHATIAYFWDGAHPVSGLTYDRRLVRSNPRNDLVSIGGTGFAFLAIVVGVSRGWIERGEACGRLNQMLEALDRVPRFHGAFPHFVNGATSEAVAFSKFDDGGDLVETALLVQGMICAREFFSREEATEAAVRSKINAIKDAVEWSWYTRGGQATLFWHWSHRHDWHMNTPITGWNEGLIAYVLGAGATRHRIDAGAYHSGWARNGTISNNNSYHGQILPMGPPYGGPLFLSHYSFCTLDPRAMRDRYADYWEQTVAHTRINYHHCVSNPGGHDGYGPACWGLTSSHGPNGYIASCPENDVGIIAPTAALSSFPFLPAEAEAALRHFFRFREGALWGKYGFVDSFSANGSWIAKTWLAINQGPIVAMIENYRSGLLWQLFMNAPEVRRGLELLDIQHGHDLKRAS